MPNTIVTLNDFFYHLKHLFHPVLVNQPIFAAEIHSSTNQKVKANETSETIHSEFPAAHGMYINVRARDYRNGD